MRNIEHMQSLIGKENAMSKNVPDKRVSRTIRQHAKRLFDIAASGLAMAVLSPIILGVALAIRFVLGRPILFNQRRPGQNGQIFMLHKFRTMRPAQVRQGRNLADDQRLSPFGNFLRRTGLDELPQLWNIFTGDMSFVGPRPLLVQYLELYSPEQARRHDVRPGITGWAQIHGRRELDDAWEEKFRLDVWYVDNWSLALDLKILWLTLTRFFKKEEIDRDVKTTSKAFKGSRKS